MTSLPLRLAIAFAAACGATATLRFVAAATSQPIKFVVVLTVISALARGAVLARHSVPGAAKLPTVVAWLLPLGTAFAIVTLAGIPLLQVGAACAVANIAMQLTRQKAVA